MSGRFTEKDRGWANLCTQFEVNAGEAAVFIGYLRSSGFYKNKANRKKGEKAKPITMAQLAAIQVYGTTDGRIPPRDFMNGAIERHGKEIEKMVKKLSAMIVLGKMDSKRALGIIGQFVKDKMVATIDEGGFKPNAPSTVARKGSSKPLVDTGQLRGAIDWVVKVGR
jgi:hypothetical protein